jgi:hypothetical protein
MDPLSLAASIIAVVGAANTVAKTISKLRSLKEAQHQFDSLHNEIEDLKAVLVDVTGVWNDHRERALQVASLPRLIGRTKEKLLELQKLVAHDLGHMSPNDGHIVVSKINWVRKRADLNRLHTEIRELRNSLTACLATIT